MEIMVGFRNASVMLDGHNRLQDSAMRYWGDGALFIKLK
jgi:hypothetical protein